MDERYPHCMLDSLDVAPIACSESLSDISMTSDPDIMSEEMSEVNQNALELQDVDQFFKDEPDEEEDSDSSVTSTEDNADFIPHKQGHDRLNSLTGNETFIPLHEVMDNTQAPAEIDDGPKIVFKKSYRQISKEEKQADRRRRRSLSRSSRGSRGSSVSSGSESCTPTSKLRYFFGRTGSGSFDSTSQSSVKQVKSDQTESNKASLGLPDIVLTAPSSENLAQIGLEGFEGGIPTYQEYAIATGSYAYYTDDIMAEIMNVPETSVDGPDDEQNVPKVIDQVTNGGAEQMPDVLDSGVPVTSAYEEDESETAMYYDPISGQYVFSTYSSSPTHKNYEDHSAIEPTQKEDEAYPSDVPMTEQNGVYDEHYTDQSAVNDDDYIEHKTDYDDNDESKLRDDFDYQSSQPLDDGEHKASKLFDDVHDDGEHKASKLFDDDYISTRVYDDANYEDAYPEEASELTDKMDYGSVQMNETPIPTVEVVIDCYDDLEHDVDEEIPEEPVMATDQDMEETMPYSEMAPVADEDNHKENELEAEEKDGSYYSSYRQDDDGGQYWEQEGQKFYEKDGDIYYERNGEWFLYPTGAAEPEEVMKAEEQQHSTDTVAEPDQEVDTDISEQRPGADAALADTPQRPPPPVSGSHQPPPPPRPPQPSTGPPSRPPPPKSEETHGEPPPRPTALPPAQNETSSTEKSDTPSSEWKPMSNRATPAKQSQTTEGKKPFNSLLAKYTPPDKQHKQRGVKKVDKSKYQTSTAQFEYEVCDSSGVRHTKRYSPPTTPAQKGRIAQTLIKKAGKKVNKFLPPVVKKQALTVVGKVIQAKPPLAPPKVHKKHADDEDDFVDILRRAGPGEPEEDERVAADPFSVADEPPKEQKSEQLETFRQLDQRIKHTLEQTQQKLQEFKGTESKESIQSSESGSLSANITPRTGGWVNFDAKDKPLTDETADSKHNLFSDKEDFFTNSLDKTPPEKKTQPKSLTELLQSEESFEFEEDRKLARESTEEEPTDILQPECLRPIESTRKPVEPESPEELVEEPSFEKSLDIDKPLETTGEIFEEDLLGLSSNTSAQPVSQTYTSGLATDDLLGLDMGDISCDIDADKLAETPQQNATMVASYDSGGDILDEYTTSNGFLGVDEIDQGAMTSADEGGPEDDILGFGITAIPAKSDLAVHGTGENLLKLSSDNLVDSADDQVTVQAISPDEDLSGELLNMDESAGGKTPSQTLHIDSTEEIFAISDASLETLPQQYDPFAPPESSKPEKSPSLDTFRSREGASSAASSATTTGEDSHDQHIKAIHDITPIPEATTTDDEDVGKKVIDNLDDLSVEKAAPKVNKDDDVWGGAMVDLAVLDEEPEEDKTEAPADKGMFESDNFATLDKDEAEKKRKEVQLGIKVLKKEKPKKEEQEEVDEADPFATRKAPSNVKVVTGGFDPFSLALAKSAKFSETKFTSVSRPKAAGSSAQDGGLIAPPPKVERPSSEEESEEEEDDGDNATVRHHTANIPTQVVYLDQKKQPPPPLDDYAIHGPPRPKFSPPPERNREDIWEDELVFEEDRVPLEPFYQKFEGDGWTMGLRIPMKKKKIPMTQTRSWKTVYVRIARAENRATLLLFDNEHAKQPFFELPLLPLYSLSKIKRQDFDEFGKLYVMKISAVEYKERPWFKADKIAPKGLGFTSIKEIKKLVTKPKITMALDHTGTKTELIKLGSLKYNEIRTFVCELQDIMMNLDLKRGNKSPEYAKDEIIVEVHDEYEGEVDNDCHIISQKARSRIFMLAFVSGSPCFEVGLNDRMRRGKECVGRHDIVPVYRDDWITYENMELHALVDKFEYDQTRIVKLVPPDAVKFEMARFRCRPKINKELPLQIKAKMNMDGPHVDIRIDVLCSAYFTGSRRADQAPCEDIQISFPVPEQWIYLFKYEKFGYRSIKSTTRRPGKIKGFERFTQLALGNPPTTLMETNTGVAKYENLTQSITWRIPCLPERNQGAYKDHLFTCRLTLQEHDVVPENFQPSLDVEFTMPSSDVSRCAIRSISVNNAEPPDKWVKYITHYKYKAEIEYMKGPPKVENPQYGYGAEKSNRFADLEEQLAAATEEQAAEADEEESSSDEEEYSHKLKVSVRPLEEKPVSDDERVIDDSNEIEQNNSSKKDTLLDL